MNSKQMEVNDQSVTPAATDNIYVWSILITWTIISIPIRDPNIKSINDKQAPTPARNIFIYAPKWLVLHTLMGKEGL